MSWLKNISEERDAPEQIILGSMDPLLCPLLNFAVHVEQMGSASVSDFVYGNPDDGHRVVRKLLDDAFKSQSFNKLRDGISELTVYAKAPLRTLAEMVYQKTL
ncbi:unnamed protein product [Aphanomyces euteiches]